LLTICFAPSLSDSFIFLTLTRLVVVLKFINFRFALFTPPLGDFQIGPDQARPVDASGRVGLAHVSRDMPKPGTHREKSCWAGPLDR
jgi:hypothetical protein